MMDWDKFRIFHASAKAGSFTRAGEALNMSQSAVSRQISTLEQDLKVTLFHRHARGLKLTEQGELLNRTASDVLAKLDATRAELIDSRTKPSGQLRVNTTMAVGSIWLPQRIHAFIDMYPDIQLTLLLSDNDRDLSMREADVGIWLHEPTQNDLIRRPLFTVHSHVYASTRYLKHFGQPTTTNDLLEHRVVTYGPEAPRYLRGVNWLETAGCAPGRSRPVTLQINSVVGVKRAVRGGVGLGVLPDYIVTDAADLVQIELDDAEVPELQAYFVYPEEMKKSKRVNVFRDFLVDQSRNWTY